jgi:hypothetical protein
VVECRIEKTNLQQIKEKLMNQKDHRQPIPIKPGE